MDTKTENKTINNAQAPVNTGAPVSARPPFKKTFGSFGGGRPGGFGERSKNPRKNISGRGERIKPEFEQKILNIRRVTRVTKGGKRMNFSIAMVVGDRKGAVGVGTGKANDTALAIDKAYRNAKKNIVRLNLSKTMSLPHDVSAKYCSGRIALMPAPGRGISAGSALKSVIDLAGIKDVTGKIVSPSKNKLNIAKAALLALSVFDKRRSVVHVKESEAKAEVKK
ncbi:MAG: 30S ribosomal protein S5 [Candidatus Paceibacterota bacterium]